MKKFEERLARLEDISEKIKEADVPLEDAFALFEEGVKLASSLEKDVEKLEGKVQLLINGKDLDTTNEAKTATGGGGTETKSNKEPEFELFCENDLS